MARDLSRARAQRATAKAVREQRRQLPARVTAHARRTRGEYLEWLLKHPEAQPAKDSIEGRSLAREASLSRYGKADARYEAAWKDYWYRTKNTVELCNLLWMSQA